MQKVAVVTVTYGNRWKYLSQVISSIIEDEHLVRLIIVDNASKNKKEIEEASEQYKGKIEIIRTEKNVGSAGGFSLGLERVRRVPCDFVFMLDDDNVPEPNAIRLLLDNYAMLKGKRIVCGLRKDIQDEAIFRQPPETSSLTKTFFNVWSLKKLGNFASRLFSLKKKINTNGFFPIIPSKGFVYGGAFLPIDAVREAPLPDKDLVLYGDDVEYSWGVLDAGYVSYLCHRPIIRDVDMSFEEGDHILGLFNPKTQPFKVYYRIRNMVRISRRNTHQTKMGLFSSICIWILGLLILAVLKYGLTLTTMKRMKLILQAVYGGYAVHAKIPHIAQLP